MVIAVGLMASCVTFHSRPLAPAQTVSAFASHSFDSPGLKTFMEKNLHHEIAPWPPQSWDFTTLTLVSFYYHPSLDAARAKWSVTEAGIITASGRPNPKLTFTPEFDANAIQGVSPWMLSFDFEIPIETGGKRGYRIAQARYVSEAARLDIASVAWHVRSRLRTSMLNLYAASQDEASLLRQLTLQQEIIRLQEQRFALGEVSRSEVTQSHLSADQTRLSLQEVQRRSAEAHVQVANALGIPITNLQKVDISFDSFERFPSAARVPLQDLRRQALINRSDVLRGLAEYAASESALQLEIAKQYPDIQLGPGYSWDQEENKWSLGVSISLPILNRNEGPIAEAEARRAEVEARFAALQARVLGEIDTALASYHAALKEIKSTDSFVAENEKYLQSMQAMFDIGEVDRLALLNAKVKCVSAERTQFAVLTKVQESLGLLEDALERPLNPLGSFPPVPVPNPRRNGLGNS